MTPHATAASKIPSANGPDCTIPRTAGVSGAVGSKPCEHLARTIKSDNPMASLQQCTRDRDTIPATDIENARPARNGLRERSRFGNARLIDALRRIPLGDQVVFTHEHPTPRGATRLEG